jgi:hypothetical protein
MVFGRKNTEHSAVFDQQLKGFIEDSYEAEKTGLPGSCAATSCERFTGAALLIHDRRRRRRAEMEDQPPNDESSETTTEVTTEWTVMGYLAGDNNLNEEMVLTLQEIVALAEMQGEVFFDRIKILAQLDPSGLGLPTQRYHFDAREKPGDEKRYVETYRIDPTTYPYAADENTGNPEALSGFVKWAVEQDTGPQAVADRYMLILSGHGSGSTEDFLMKDDNPVDSLSIPELDEALDMATKALGEAAGKEKDERKNIDVLGMDCCFMSMVEVCYQIRNYVDHVVAAESMIPDFGWPYHRILAEAERIRNYPAGPVIEADTLTRIIVTEYIKYYSDYDRTAGRSVDLAWVNVGGKIDPEDPSSLTVMDNLKEKISQLGSALSDALGEPRCLDQILLAHWRAQTYKFDQFVDIKDFCDKIVEGFTPLGPPNWEPKEWSNEEKDAWTDEQAACHPVLNACAAVNAALADCVELSGCSGFAYQHSYGLSIYLPWAHVMESYKYEEPEPPPPSVDEWRSFDFAKDNSWVDFIKKYVEETRRTKREAMKKEDDAPNTWIELDEIVSSINELGESVGGLNPGQVKKFAKGQLKHFSRVRDIGGASDPHAGSRYHRSRYHRSRYHRSRWPGDREKSVKNFPPVVGKAYHPFWPPEG